MPAGNFDAILFDAGGVLVLPDPTVLGPVLAYHGGDTSVAAHVRAHYAGMAAKSVAGVGEAFWLEYNRAYVRAVGVAEAEADLAAVVLERTRNAWLWRWAVPSSVVGLRALHEAGVPLGVVCYRVASVRQPLLNVLNIIQTIPSIALFGILIPPLAWLAANAPLASELGISGIGAAPALIALFGYALLPVVTNTLAGLNGVPEATRDAALGMGMTDGQKFLRVELPLAFPVILTGIRIVLVQNIGLATIAALIGGGGFGVFVFQGMGQTAIDLILLGALPTVFLSFAAAVVLDALVELSARRGNARSAA